MRLISTCLMVLTVAVFLGGCSQRNSDQTATTSEVERPYEPKRILIPDEALDPLDSLSTVEPIIEDHLFGKFFNDRAVFYVIQYPTNTLFDKPVDEITICYLDGKLSQTRYMLHDDLTNNLIAKYGKFKFMPFDPENNERLQTENLLVQESGGVVLNPQFDNYQLAWNLPDKLILIRVDKRSEQMGVIYTERHRRHRINFSRIELASN